MRADRSLARLVGVHLGSHQRLLLARRLLLHTQGAGRNVSDIAYTAGFNDLSYFHHAFRRKFGAAPAELQMELGRRH